MPVRIWWLLSCSDGPQPLLGAFLGLWLTGAVCDCPTCCRN
jgi:hypothetical protein